MRRCLGLAVLVAVACGGPAPRGPEAAFARLRVAIVARDPGLLYDALDLESRWAVETVWKYHRDIAELVERTYPAARVALAVRSAGPREFFGAWAAEHDLIAALGGDGDHLGGLVRVEPDGVRARVATTTGLTVPLAVGADGTWGYAGLRDELDRWRDDAGNDLSRTKASAALYARTPR